MIKSKIERALLQVNKIPLDLVESMTVVGSTIVCRLKEPQRARCPECGTLSSSVKNRYQRKLVGISILGYQFEVRLTRVHFRCRNDFCVKKTFAPNLKVADGKSPYLPALKDYLAREYFVNKRNNHEIVRDVKGRYQVQVSESTLRRLQEQEKYEPLQLSPVVLGIDEIYPKGRHGVCTSLHDLTSGILMGLVKGVRQIDVKRLLEKIKEQGLNLGRVKYIYRDLYPHWDKPIKEVLGKHVTIIADPFHVVKRIQQLVYQGYYAPLRKRLRAEGKTKESLELFYARWAFKRGAEKLTGSQSNRLMPILNRYELLDKAWILKEKLRHMYQAEDRTEARKRLIWVIVYARNNGFKKVYKTLRKNQLSILNIYGDCNGVKRKLNHHPEERISQIRRVERRRGCFRKLDNLVRNVQVGYQMIGLIG